MLTALKKLYFFSEEKNTCNIRDEQYVICMDNPATLLIKLYKWSRGRTQVTAVPLLAHWPALGGS